jgi:NADH:ubiquinone oxidoreductase subunit 4 (subunit M)
MVLTLLQSFVIALLFNPNDSQFQFQYLGLGLDGLALVLILLTTFLMPICLLAEPEMTIPFLLIESLLMAVFLTLDVLAFYLCFESVLIPLFYLIGKYQGRSRRLSAALSLYLFTLGGSLLMLIGIGFLYLEASSTNLQLLLSVPLNHHYQLLLFVAFFFAFAIKVPMVPFHL